jgi:hypothetical protein
MEGIEYAEYFVMLLILAGTGCIFWMAKTAYERIGKRKGNGR